MFMRAAAGPRAARQDVASELLQILRTGGKQEIGAYHGAVSISFIDP
jgi:hypothetical protein